MAFWKKKAPVEPMISQAEHDALKVALNDMLASRDQYRNQAAGLRIQNETHVELGQSRERQFKQVVAERDDLAAEVATLKAERDRRMAPLIAANAARAAKARAKQTA